MSMHRGSWIVDCLDSPQNPGCALSGGKEMLRMAAALISLGTGMVDHPDEIPAFRHIKTIALRLSDGNSRASLLPLMDF